MELRRRGFAGQRYELAGDDGVLVAEITVRAMREAGVVTTVDGREWHLARQPGFGPWHTTAADGAVLVTTTKLDLRERFDLSWPAGRWRVERRGGFFRRRLEVLDTADGQVVGEVVQTSPTRGIHHLSVPLVADEVLATIAFLAVLLDRRDQSAGAG